MKTFVPTKESAQKDRKWVVVDAAGVPVGRLATRVASILRGKTKTSYTPYVDTGDFVVVINAAQARFTGKKLESKVYYQHTGYIGGLAKTSARELMEKNPEIVIEKAVQGMLPTGPLGFAILKKLKVYAGADHPHKAQTPEAVSVGPT